jgi:hypothetical protein
VSTGESSKTLAQALILADSFNHRFTPITLEIPRTLMPLVNVPMLDYCIEFLVCLSLCVYVCFWLPGELSSPTHTHWHSLILSLKVLLLAHSHTCHSRHSLTSTTLPLAHNHLSFSLSLSLSL